MGSEVSPDLGMTNVMGKSALWGGKKEDRAEIEPLRASGK
jgi:hypothetical protein